MTSIISILIKNVFLIYTYVLLVLFFLQKKGHFKKTFFISLIIFFIITLTPISQILLYKLENIYIENSKEIQNIDGIVILSGNHDTRHYLNTNSLNLNETGKRIITGLTLKKKHPNAKIIFSGNSNHLNPNLKSNADIKFFFDLMGHEKSLDIIYELNSKSTFENLIYSRDVADPKYGETWVIVSSAYHLNRIKLISNKIGWDVKLFPADVKIDKIEFFSKYNWSYFATFLREISTTLFYLISDRA